MEIKGIVHCHSLYSYDAKLSLPALKALAQEEGCHFICMTEHTDEMTPANAESFVRECEEHSDETFLFIPGFEVPYPISGSRDHAHILMIGAREFVGAYAPDSATLAEWASRASFVVLAHPVRNQFIVDTSLLEKIDALEVWNQQYEGKKVPRVRSLALYQELRTKKPTLVATGGVDLHRFEHTGSPFISMHVLELTEKSIIERLRAGDFLISSPYAEFSGLPHDIPKLIRLYRLHSAISILIIMSGKWVNATLARLGIKLPSGLAVFVRRRL